MTSFVLSFGVTFVLLLAVVGTGLLHKQRAHIALVVVFAVSLALTIYFAERLGRSYDLDSAGWITPLHLTLAKTTTLAFLGPVITGIQLLRTRDDAWRNRHRFFAALFTLLTVTCVVTGTWMIAAANPL